MKTYRTWLAAWAMALMAATPSLAAYRPTDSEIDPKILRIDEKKILGNKALEGLALVDEMGREFSLLDGPEKARILVLSYYGCEGACPAFSADLSGILQRAEALGRVSSGKDYNVVTISFDKNDTPAVAAHFKSMIQIPEGLAKNWTFAVLKEKGKIKELTERLDFHYFWSFSDKMFYHSNAYFFISPEGRVVRVLHSSAVEAKDMELALIDTFFDRIRPSQVLTMAMSFCYSYNYKEGKYGINYPLIFGMGSVILGIGAFGISALIVRKRGKSKENQI